MLSTVVVAALGGCLSADGPATTIERERTVEPGSFVEANLAMNGSAELTYRWSTSPSTEVAFDVHSHPSRDEVAYHERYNATGDEGSFTAPSEGTYSLLWENRGEEPVTVSFRIEGEVELVSIAP